MCVVLVGPTSGRTRQVSATLKARATWDQQSQKAPLERIRDAAQARHNQNMISTCLLSGVCMCHVFAWQPAGVIIGSVFLCIEAIYLPNSLLENGWVCVVQ